MPLPVAILETQETGAAVGQRTFAGHEYDVGTGLSYMEARYYDPRIGRFLSEDPVFLDIGSVQDENRYKKLQAMLADPQGLNSYAYARNNPLRYIDPDGQWFKEVLTGQQSLNSFVVELGDAGNQLYASSGIARAVMDHPVAAGAAIGVGSGLVAYGGAAALTAVSNTWLGGVGTACIAACSTASQDANETGLNIAAANGHRVTGMTSHAVDRAIGDNAGRMGVKPGSILDALRNPLKIGQPRIDSLGRPSLRMIGQKAEVVINPASGEIVSVNPTSTEKAAKLLDGATKTK